MLMLLDPKHFPKSLQMRPEPSSIPFNDLSSSQGVFCCAFTVLAKVCSPKANETEVGVALLTENGEGRNFDLEF